MKEKKKKLNRFFLFVAVFFLLQNLGCSAKNENLKKFGANADYFLGLKLLEQNNEKEAKFKFKRCIKKGDELFAQKSAQKLCELGTFEEKTKATVYFAENFCNSENKNLLVFAAQQFEKLGENSLILKYTQNLDFENAPNELIKIRLCALKNLESANYESEVFEWFTKRTISKEHYLFYRDFYNHPDFYDIEENSENNEIDFEKNPELLSPFLINFRIELYKRNYTYTFSQSQKIINLMKCEKIPANAQLASDIGKSVLYAASDFKKAAENFIQLADFFEGKNEESDIPNEKSVIKNPMTFYFWFYAGRFYEKTGVMFEKAKFCFQNAINFAESNQQKDNALWYLLDTLLEFSADSLVKNIGIYAQQFDNPEYFDDFFDSFSTVLLSLGRWNDFETVYQKIDGFATDESTAKFAYIFARLSQEKIASGSKNQIEKAFLRACRSGSSFYYKILSAYHLNLDSENLEKILFSPVKSEENRDKIPEKNEILSKKSVKKNAKSLSFSDSSSLLMEGYVAFGFPKMIYSEWQTYFSDLPEKTNFYLADFLFRCGKSDPKSSYYTQSLRIAAKAYNRSFQELTQEEMQTVFPKCFSQIVEKYCDEYSLAPNVVYALIRSESFFDPNIKSSVGAVGLTQMMELTANDVARKLKMKEFSLTDAETNVQMGTFYLAELLRRCDNFYLQAFFSYNAGITRVRRWLKSSLSTFGRKNNLPMDLFLETLPYSETREYGRKLVSAAVMYDYLENPENFAKTVELLISK